MHYFLLNLLQTIKRPRLKLWFRLPYHEPVEKVTEQEVEYVNKGPLTESRLASVSLMVDTGGIYSSDDYRPAGVKVSAAADAPLPDQAPLPGVPLSTGGDNSGGMNFGRKL